MKLLERFFATRWWYLGRLWSCRCANTPACRGRTMSGLFIFSNDSVAGVKNHKTTNSARNGKESSPPPILCFTIFFQTLGKQNSERTLQLKHFRYFWMHLIGTKQFGMCFPFPALVMKYIFWIWQLRYRDVLLDAWEKPGQKDLRLLKHLCR